MSAADTKTTQTIKRSPSLTSPFSLTTTTHPLPQILLKALLNLPATDFTLLLYILPEKLQTDVRVGWDLVISARRVFCLQ